MRRRNPSHPSVEQRLNYSPARWFRQARGRTGKSPGHPRGFGWTSSRAASAALLALNEAAVDDLDAVAGAEARLGCEREGAALAVLHSDDYVPAFRRLDVFLDLMAPVGAGCGTGDRRDPASAAIADLVAEHP